MTQPGYPNEPVQSPQTPTPPSAAPQPSAPPIVIQTTPTQPATEVKSDSGSRLARRALFAATGVGACAVGVALVPAAAKLVPGAVNQIGEYTKDQLDAAFSAGIEQGRQAIINELANLEGVTIDGAINVAEVTRQAVRYIVLPLARLNAVLTGDILGALSSGLSFAHDRLDSINVHIDALDALQSVVASWQQNVALLPLALANYANADIDSAESYLKALKQKIQNEQQGTPTSATPSPTK